MRHIVSVFILLILINIAQADDEITITTYYPSPYGVYRTLKLEPQANPPSAGLEGEMYYNLSEHVVKYRNNTGWQNLTGGSGGGCPAPFVIIGVIDTACNGICNAAGHTCAFGQNRPSGSEILSCTDANADVCACCND